jgi:hypothetical protein
MPGELALASDAVFAAFCARAELLVCGDSTLQSPPKHWATVRKSQRIAPATLARPGSPTPHTSSVKAESLAAESSLAYARASRADVAVRSSSRVPATFFVPLGNLSFRDCIRDAA